ncbi:MAG: hypothetical protein N6V49_14225, partial [Serratia symbiotica]|nr:hypothetical protein [Serratia symbiotica]
MVGKLLVDQLVSQIYHHHYYYYYYYYYIVRGARLNISERLRSKPVNDKSHNRTSIVAVSVRRRN